MILQEVSLAAPNYACRLPWRRRCHPEQCGRRICPGLCVTGPDAGGARVLRVSDPGGVPGRHRRDERGRRLEARGGQGQPAGSQSPCRAHGGGDAVARARVATRRQGCVGGWPGRGSGAPPHAGPQCQDGRAGGLQGPPTDWTVARWTPRWVARPPGSTRSPVCCRAT